MVGIASNYSSSLDMNSSTFTRNGGAGTFYFEAIHVTPKRTGNYTFRSYSTIDSYGYLYMNSFDPSNVTSNLLTYADDDENGTSDQFFISYTLQAGTTYILIFTTFDNGLTGPFSIVALGPAKVSFLRSNVMPTPPLTTSGKNY